jgi:hypothetical protein
VDAKVSDVLLKAITLERLEPHLGQPDCDNGLIFTFPKHEWVSGSLCLGQKYFRQKPQSLHSSEFLRQT